MQPTRREPAALREWLQPAADGADAGSREYVWRNSRKGFGMTHSEARGPATSPEVQPAGTMAGGRPHLVVVTTRAVDAARDPDAPHGSRLVTRFWHPRDRAWSENHFESLEHAARLFIDESGWRLLQQQTLGAALSWELIFEARRADFARPSTDDILRDIGMTPERVAELLDRPPPPGN